jgi:hypothetical protein
MAEPTVSIRPSTDSASENHRVHRAKAYSTLQVRRRVPHASFARIT